MKIRVLLASVLVLIACRRAPKPTPKPLPPSLASLKTALDRQKPAPGYQAPPLENPAAYIPAQCYAATEDAPGGRTHNGCFTCHQKSLPPNFVNDADVQMQLSFANAATENRWSNALHPPAPVAITDSQLLSYVRTSNYFGERGEPRLAAKLAHPPAAWDANGDGKFGGYVPDAYFHADARGFDRAPDGRATGWRAYSYAPFPGMFWPTNGSAGDVFIRLPEAYRKDADGRDSEAIYALNLAILEAAIRRVDVPIAATDESALGVDLDRDGVLGSATRVAFVWPPKPDKLPSYVGQAKKLDADKEGWPAAGLYPRGTEFLHSVRYLDVDGGHVRMAARMKELRYMRKMRWETYGELETSTDGENREKRRHPDRLRHLQTDAELGVGTGTGWRLQAFIEDADGNLRPQSIEETAACVGCHGGVGAPTDSTFTFARKLGSASPDGGWYYGGVTGIPEPKRADGQGEYAHWLQQVGGGDDFRANDEVQARFFRPDGKLRPEALRALAKDISTLIVPSPRRALQLDRAYLALVRAQSFTHGRDVLVGTPHLHERTEQDALTGIKIPVPPRWGKAEPPVASRR